MVKSFPVKRVLLCKTLSSIVAISCLVQETGRQSPSVTKS